MTKKELVSMLVKLRANMLHLSDIFKARCKKAPYSTLALAANIRLGLKSSLTQGYVTVASVTN